MNITNPYYLLTGFVIFIALFKWIKIEVDSQYNGEYNKLTRFYMHIVYLLGFITLWPVVVAALFYLAWIKISKKMKQP